jgi:hypothetical protein
MPVVEEFLKGYISAGFPKEVTIRIVGFLVMTQCSLTTINVLEEHTASIFRIISILKK